MIEEIMSKKQIKKAKELGIFDECDSIAINCDCGELHKAELIDLNKIRKWEIMEWIGNDSEQIGEDAPDWTDFRTIKSFCKAFEIPEEDLSKYFALSISNGGYSIAYAITSNIVLVFDW